MAAINLKFFYDGIHKALDFEYIPVTERKITVLIGPNDRGKTTFLRCLTGLEKDRSVLDYHGKQLHRKERRQKVYLITQDVNCQLFTREVRDEIEISLPEHVRRNPASADEMIQKITAFLDLTDILNRDPATLASGQKQRTAIAAAIASYRNILVLDEPTSGLDLRHMQEISKLLKKCSAVGKKIIVATHDSELIRACADCAFFLM